MAQPETFSWNSVQGSSSGPGQRTSLHLLYEVLTEGWRLMFCPKLQEQALDFPVSDVRKARYQRDSDPHKAS